MIIKNLEVRDYNRAIDLRYNCWTEELANKAPNRMIKEKELAFLIEWINSAEKYNDIRLVYGAYDNDNLLGFIGASIAEEDGVENAIELNYLYVNEEFRGQGISLKMINKVLDYFSLLSYKNLIVFNPHYAPSNAYYRKLDGKVIRTEIQGEPLDHLEIDIFLFDINELNERIKTKIKGEYNV